MIWPGIPANIPEHAQADPPSSQEEQEKKEKEKKDKYKPLPIPALKTIQREQAQRYLKFLKTSNPKKRVKYEEKMIALGRGVIPLLLEKAETDHKHQAEGIARCLTTLLDARDSAILGGFSKSKKIRLRLIAVLKFSEARDPKYQEQLKVYLKDKDPSIRFEAAAGLVSLGDGRGVGEIILKLAEGRSREIERALADIKLLYGKVFDSLFTPYVCGHDDPKVRKAGIEIIVIIGDRKLKTVLVKALNDDHNLVKAAAVNGLRKLLKNQEPIKFPTVFDLVNAVEKWKKEAR